MPCEIRQPIHLLYLLYLKKSFTYSQVSSVKGLMSGNLVSKISALMRTIFGVWQTRNVMTKPLKCQVKILESEDFCRCRLVA